jgi:NADH dehydrogenase
MHESACAPRVVIVGAGFGGLAAAQALQREPVSVTLVDRRNHHLFQPLLYQVATAGLSPSDIAWPVRWVFRRRPSVLVLLDEVQGIDRAAREIVLPAGRIPYDFLVLAPGVSHNYYGHPEWAASAPGLKTVEDATAIRRRILVAFERAEMTGDAAERDRLLTFVVVGGGPTGVELAGAIGELARKVLAADFRRINTRATRVLLVEAGERLLPALPPSLSGYARRALERLGVEVLLGRTITSCEPGGVRIDGEFQAAATALWAAGVEAGPLAGWLGAGADRQGRVHVRPDLSVPGAPEIFVIGDAARIQDATFGAVPGLAPAAKQAGRYVGRVIAARVRGAPPPPPFRYRHQGNLATIGRHSAVIDFGRVRLRGYVAWWLWGGVHIFFLIGVRNRVLVIVQWLWSYLTFQRGARLITGSPSGAD